uniref:SFRICE_024035 n=1 Tax=Spodoptera frugiperda TaxID=7108 RepID=A0A2H1WQX7_SPOFR
MHKDCSLLEDNDLTRLEENELIDKVALPRDLINGECTIPDKLDRFFKTLIGGRDIRRKNGVNCKRLSNSIVSDTIFCVTNGTIKPSKHITLGMTIKSLTSSRKIINILNRLGHCCNYTTLEELETEATYSSEYRTEISPPDIIRKSSLCTGVAFDNFDRYVDTHNGKETLHDTVGIIYQNIDNDTLNGSDIDPGSDQSKMLPPPLLSLNLFRFLQMLDRLTPTENIHQFIPNTLSLVQTIDLLHVVSLFFHVPNTPMWTGFNFRIIKDDTPKQKVSYLTPINLSPTETSVVKLTMTQAQKVGVECNQKYVQVTYDLAIAKIAL